MIRFGISGLPPEDGDDAAFLDGLVERGHQAFELGFTRGFPWKEKRCSAFGELAAERGIALSIHAPYFAVLTVEEPDRARQCAAAVEHTMKLAAAMGAGIVCAHLGSVGDRTPERLHEIAGERLEWIGAKVAHLDVSLGLETAGNDSGFGTLGDIGLLSERFPFVRPLVDWAHVHAQTRGALVSVESFAAVIEFIRATFPAHEIHPLQTQFSDNEIGPHGEIRHVRYGDGTLRVTPLVEAAMDAGLDMVVISEARDDDSHRRIQEEYEAAMASHRARAPGRPVGTVPRDDPVRVERQGDRWRVLGSTRRLTITNPDKPFFPDGYTKGDLIEHYAEVAPILLPHLAGRPISMSRYPDGIDGPSFYEKRAPGHRPEWMATAPVPSESMGGEATFLLADSAESLMWFANMACIEIHPFHSRVGSLDRPDYAIFDLDPAEGSTWDQVVTAAGMVRTVLDRLGLVGHPKLSGARGLHVYVPLVPEHTFERVRAFVGAVGRLMADANADDVTMEWDIPKRRGKIFVDHNRNASGQTIASVYSVRPRPGAPVSVPLRWDEVGEIRNGDITIVELPGRLSRVGDLFAGVLAGGQRLDEAEAMLGISPGR